jgi:hypothetical protein
MSVTQDYKIVKLTGAQAFAVARALRGRIDVLGDMIADAALSPPETAAYLSGQRAAAENALAALTAAPRHVVPATVIYAAKYENKQPVLQGQEP